MMKTKNLRGMARRIMFCVSLTFPLLHAQDSGSASVLRTGNWYKLSVFQRGIYKVDQKLLTQMGLNPQELKPTHAKIYGYGGLVPAANQSPRPKDLPQIATHLIHDDPDQWTDRTLLLFYAQDANNYVWDSENQQMSYEKNPYTDSTYYFLRFSEEEALRIKTADKKEQTSSRVIKTYHAVYVHEEEKLNLLQSGRLWVSQPFSLGSGLRHSYPLKKPLIPLANTWSLTSEIVGRCYGTNCAFEIFANGEKIGRQEVEGIHLQRYARAGRLSKEIFSVPWTPSTQDLEISYVFSPLGQTGYINYFLLQGKANLIFDPTQGILFFLHAESEDQEEVLQFELDGQPEYVWDLSEPFHPSAQILEFSGNTTSFQGSSDTRLYVAFLLSEVKTPGFSGTVQNQNLRGREVPNMLIITASHLRSEAERLASLRRRERDFKVEVLSPQEIYNEFSSGRVDVGALRDYARFLYTRDPNRFQYLLLFGDCHYDIRNIEGSLDPEIPAQMVPTYASRESLDPLRSYSSDDYYGFLEEEDGLWPEEGVRRDETEESKVHDLEIGIGRIPVQSLKQARQVVDKLIFYDSHADTGPWRRKIVFVADDGENNSIHRETEELANTLAEQAPALLVEKLFLDAHKQIRVGGNQESESCRMALQRLIDEGAFLINFIGHGSTKEWMDERILIPEDINLWTNIRRLPVFFTGTCEFGRYDASDVSGGEQLILSPHGGAIALLTATRPIFGFSNFEINKAFYQGFYAFSTHPPRLGDIIRRTKNEGLVGIYNRSFALLGDPSMSLAYPTHQILITHLNGIEFEHFTDTLRALSFAEIKGEIRPYGQNIQVHDYEGELLLSLYDKDLKLSTLGDENPPFPYLDPNILFQGKVSVRAGRFNARIFLSKNISHQAEKRGLIQGYASHALMSQDAIGGTRSFFLGGVGKNGPTDIHPPRIHMYLNDPSFQNGDAVNSRPILLAELNDPHGINLSRLGPDKNIVAHLKSAGQGPETSYLLRNFFTYHLDSYQTGNIMFPLGPLEAGKYSLSLSASDNFNNTAIDSLHFIVSDQLPVRLSHVVLYPNPVKSRLHISFQHDRGNRLLEINLFFYDPYGKLHSRTTWNLYGNEGKIQEITWDPTSIPTENPLPDGLYIYKLIVEDKEENTYGEVGGKLIFSKE
ncbi:MAG: type IX secretion system sortase PorU [Cytophagales bacterium]|nr:type IX secretion system sortase PorU [Cytophagales bacterium]